MRHSSCCCEGRDCLAIPLHVLNAWARFLKIDRNGPRPRSGRIALAPLISLYGFVVFDELGTVKFPSEPPGRGRVVIGRAAVAVDDPSTATLELVVGMADRPVEAGDVVETGMFEVVEGSEDEIDDKDEVTLERVDVVPSPALPDLGPAWKAGASSGEEFPSQVV